jgi:hypothetical protein
LKYEDLYLTTFETPEHDPPHIQILWVSEDKDANLFPSRLPLPLLRDPIQRFRGGRVQKAYGYPICWSQPNFEWYPYLPAVVTFNYPIFRLMSTDPTIIHGPSGYKLSDDDISLWRNVEYVISTAIRALQTDRLLPLGHQEPRPPSEYGYTRVYSQEKFSRKAVMKSLNAFQRLLAYCSYSLAGRCCSPDPLKPAGNIEEVFSLVYQQLDQSSSGVHILAKDLYWTLHEIYSTRNFTGIVVAYSEQYNFPAVNSMYHHRVPVYISWPFNRNPYLKFDQSFYIRRWLPLLSMVQKFEQPPHPSGPLNNPPNPTPLSSITYKQTYDTPMDYVNKRCKEIPDELARSPNKQSMQDRLRSAQKITSIGKASYYTFEQVTVVSQTGEMKERWVRKLLTRHEALEHFEDVDNAELWYDHLFRFPFSFLSNLVGLTASRINGTIPTRSPLGKADT